jgi:hypothetical protein
VGAVRAAFGLSRYSLNYQLLIALQTSGLASFVAGFRAWLELGYAVRKGERAIRILAPMTARHVTRTRRPRRPIRHGARIGTGCCFARSRSLTRYLVICGSVSSRADGG